MAWEKIFNLFCEKKYTALEREALGFHVQFKHIFAFYEHIYIPLLVKTTVLIATN